MLILLLLKLALPSSPIPPSAYKAATAITSISLSLSYLCGEEKAVLISAIREGGVWSQFRRKLKGWSSELILLPWTTRYIQNEGVYLYSSQFEC
jgi:hypothetical protein